MSRRQVVQLRVDVLPLLDGAQQPWRARPRQATTLDINEHGMLCSQVGYLPMDSVVRLFIRLPDLQVKPLACQARVVRCDFSAAPSYGLRFISLPLSDARRLQRWAAGFHAPRPSCAESFPPRPSCAAAFRALARP